METDIKYFIEDLTYIFDSIIDELLAIEGKNYKYVIDYKEFYLTTKEFIFTFDPKSCIFILSFVIGQPAVQVANIMAIILKYIESEELQIMKDCYFKEDENKLVFGQEALLTRQIVLLKKTGREICPMCDNIVPLAEITKETIICKKCITNFNDINWC